jgi:hypothetical protein
MTTIFKYDRKYGEVLDQGSVEHGITDKLGRSVGYKWNIREVVYTEMVEEPGKWCGYYTRKEGQPLRAIEMWGTPTRNGQKYGPSFNYVEFNTLEEARQAAVKRVEQAAKRDIKKFRKEVAA